MGAFRLLGNRWFWICMGIAVIGAGVWGWTERQHLLARYYTNRLAKAADAERAECLQRLAELDDAAIGPLVGRLASPEESARINCGWALRELAGKWGLHHKHTAKLARALAKEYLTLTPDGRDQSLLICLSLYEIEPENAVPESIAEACGQILVACLTTEDAALKPNQLRLAFQYASQMPSRTNDGVEACKAMAKQSLNDPRPECRVAAIRLAALSSVNQLDGVHQLLCGAKPEPSPEARHQALLAIGPPEYDQIAPTDDLFPFLHDEDSGVAYLCAKVLGSRGMSPEQIQLTKKMTHPEPSIRAQAPELAFDFPSDAGACLTRLSQDPSPSVRAAVLRAIDEYDDGKFAALTRRLAQHDPDQTVRQIARHYLSMIPGVSDR